MKLLLFIFSAFLTAYGLSENEEWALFKQNHGKRYNNIVEEKLRFQFFKENLNKINEHNARYENGESSYYMGINRFADMTEKEFKEMLLQQQPTKPDIKATYAVFPEKLGVPDSFDWRTRGVVLGIKDQGECGACWAFSATGALEGQNAILNNVTIPLSEQELIDCSSLYGNFGCFGGYMGLAFDYVEDHGIQSESSYPYTATSDPGSCKLNKNETVLKIKSHLKVASNEDALKKAIGSVGPISVALSAGLLQQYEGGIFDDQACQNNQFMLDHAVLAIGYGSDSGKDYWILKNSWGVQWGEKGFFRLKRNPSLCGVLLDSSYPVLN